MKKSILLIVLILFYINVYGQKKGFFQFDQIHVNQIYNAEKKMNSEKKFVEYLVTVSDDYFPNAATFDLVQPKIYTRPKKRNFISCNVNYYFTKPDMLVRLITYTWNPKNNVTSLNDLLDSKNNQSGKVDKYNAEFDKIAKSLTKQLGDAVEGTGAIEVIQEEGYSNAFERNLKWVKDGTTVELIMLWYDNNTGMGTYKIRAKIYWNE